MWSTFVPAKAFDIWEARGTCARGCRLDERGLIDVEATILAAIENSIDLLVINRLAAPRASAGDCSDASRQPWKEASAC
jgi:hypothetical protein